MTDLLSYKLGTKMIVVFDFNYILKWALILSFNYDTIINLSTNKNNKTNKKHDQS